MKELSKNEEPEKEVSFVKDKISLVTTAVIFVLINLLAYVFEGTWKSYFFILFLLLLYLIVQQVLNKKTHQSFDFKEFFKKSVFYSIALLIGFCFFELANSFSAGFSNGIISKLMSIVSGFIILFWFIFVIQFIEKPSKS